MENEKKHLAIGTAICLATMLIYLAFWSRLPDPMPVQIAADGSMGNTLPKSVVVFGLPVIFAVLNALNWTKTKKGASAFGFYIVPAIAIVLSILTVALALRVQA
ncbi:MAG: DUF1648 domain-containing protein [Clostridiales bacterium]|jgi:uncharacterized membrane protein|nr:DUF1648 domain-containing protein [Clostridiales bacterium]